MTNRPDGRASNHLRPVTFTPNFTAHAEGSVLVKTGQTWVLCNASVEDGVPPWREASGSGWLTAEYAMLPRSTHRRISRRRGGESSRSQEIQRLIGRSLRAAFDLDVLGQRTVIVDCDVIQADGGTRTASITGGYVAVVLALDKLIAAGKIPKSVLLQPVAAVSVGMVDNTCLLDLCYEEDSTAAVDLNVVMTGEGKFIEIQGTAEGQPFAQAELLAMLALARQGIDSLLAEQQKALGQATQHRSAAG